MVNAVKHPFWEHGFPAALGMTMRWGLAALAAVAMTFSATPTAGAAAAVGNCRFTLGFGAIHDAIPEVAGSCLENQHFAANGDAQQQTSRGLMAWIKADNLAKFTDGYRTWLSGPTGLVSRFNDEWFEWEAYPAETHGVPVVEDPPAPVSPTEVSLGALVHTDQTMNNCGPSSIAEVLRYYGVTKTQQELQAILRPSDPSGMEPWGIPAYAQTVGMRTLLSRNGNDQLLKSLLRAGFPAIVEDLISATDPGEHYRPVEGYDDTLGQFITADPLLGPRHAISYGEFNQIWAPTRNLFVVIYPPSKQPALDAALAAAGWQG